MNAISNISQAVSEPAAMRHAALSRDAHVFRSRFIDKFAQVERWAVGRIEAARPKEKAPHLVGRKIETASELAAQRPDLFKSASTTANLINCLGPYLALRSALAHSSLSVGEADDGEALLIFDHAAEGTRKLWSSRVTLRESELSKILRDVSDLANRLRQQTPGTLP